MTVLSSSGLYGQSAVAELHFESAEKAYNAGKYREVLAKSDETEKLSGATSKTLYLRILSQDKLFAGGRNYAQGDFELLSDLRSHVATYLEAMADQGLDDRYREVYRIGESLSKFPHTQEEWTEKRNEEIRLKKEREEQAIAESKLREEREELLRTSERESFFAGTLSANQVRHNKLAREASQHTRAEDVATFYFIRPGKFVASLATIDLYMNEQEVLKIRNKQHIVKRFSPGLFHLVQRIALKNKELQSTFLDLQGGHTYYLMIDIKGVSGLVDLILIDEEEALPLLEQTKLMD